MDFAKAFDKVDHILLIHKLHHYGIRGEVNTWIKNWLKDRTQSVVVEGEKSEPVSVDSGAHGSVLGPGLFLYYINNLPERLRSRVRLFVDDTIAYLLIILPKDTEALQEDLGYMEEQVAHGVPRQQVCGARGTDKSPLEQKPTRTKAHWTISHLTKAHCLIWQGGQ